VVMKSRHVPCNRLEFPPQRGRLQEAHGRRVVERAWVQS
jgi:hypothetical protein